MTDFDQSDFTTDDSVPVTVQAPDISPAIDIGPDDPTFQAPTIMGGVDFSGDDLPMQGQAQNNVPHPTARPYFNPQAVGVGNALADASTAVKVAHGTIGALGGAGKMAGLLSGGSPALDGLPTVTNAITAPLDFVAGTAKDLGTGNAPDVSVFGNAVREGLVQAAGIAGGSIAGTAAGMFTDGVGFPLGERIGRPVGMALANWSLPNGAVIGHAISDGFLDKSNRSP